jgi:hypothetical protein
MKIGIALQPTDVCLLFHRFHRFCGYFVAKIVVFIISRKGGQ